MATTLYLTPAAYTTTLAALGTMWAQHMAESYATLVADLA